MNRILVYLTSRASSGCAIHRHSFGVLWITSDMNDSSQYGIEVIKGIALDRDLSLP